ncbi:MAG TPA: CDP-alcohol phosphatidyltransferase family protein [Spirochaetia bacterium]|nr:CDP-alcohol phosphatidyltransferase family protein [Spirochaetia bacterium]
MTLPMALTVSRLVLAPVFFVLFELAGRGPSWLLAPVCVVFAVMEISDLLDGHAARTLKLESEIGKVLDPFADSLSRLTYFVAFAGAGILPLWILLILIYRDVTVAYIRVMVSRGSVLMPARASGKVKAWVYAVAGIGGIVDFSLVRLGWFADAQPRVHEVTLVLFVLAGAIAVWSLVDYGTFFLRNFRKSG